MRPPHVPWLTLDREGDITNLNKAARRVLEFGPQDLPKPNFFSYVDGRNLRRVMWDLARMVKRSVQRARWLLRLRTGKDRWRWYRVAARNKLRSEGAVELVLQPMGTVWQGV